MNNSLSIFQCNENLNDNIETSLTEFQQFKDTVKTTFDKNNVFYKQFFIKIIIPCFNCENTIETMLNSILMQKFQDFFIIAVNDKSTDNTLNILLKYQSEYKDKIHVITPSQKEYGGGCRSIGFQYDINSIYTWFVDADDYIQENALQEIYDEYLKTDADMYTIDCNMYQYSKYDFNAPWFRICKTIYTTHNFLKVLAIDDILQFYSQYEKIDESKVIHIPKILYFYTGSHSTVSNNNDLILLYNEIKKLNLQKNWLKDRFKIFENQLKNKKII